MSCQVEICQLSLGQNTFWVIYIQCEGNDVEKSTETNQRISLSLYLIKYDAKYYNGVSNYPPKMWIFEDQRDISTTSLMEGLNTKSCCPSPQRLCRKDRDDRQLICIMLWLVIDIQSKFLHHLKQCRPCFCLFV